MSDQRPSDAEPEPAVTDDGALEPGSTAEGSGTGAELDGAVPDRLREHEHPDVSDPDRLVEGNRVARPEDLEP